MDRPPCSPFSTTSCVEKVREGRKRSLLFRARRHRLVAFDALEGFALVAFAELF
jgi:hypothetical protein